MNTEPCPYEQDWMLASGVVFPFEEDPSDVHDYEIRERMSNHRKPAAFRAKR